MDKNVDVSIFVRKAARFSIEAISASIRANLPKYIRQKMHVVPFVSRGLFPRIGIGLFCFLYRGRVNHITGDIHFAALFMPGSRTVLTINDLVALHDLTGLKRIILWLFWYQLPALWVQRIIVISAFIRDELLQYCPSVKATKVRVIHVPLVRAHGYSPRHFNDRCPTILLIGTKKNKNIERMARALDGLPCKVNIVGELDKAQSTLLQSLSINYANCTDISDDALYQLYVECDIVLFCSTYEGFGMPIIEAQSVGRVVITSNICSMPEVGGNGACYVDPYDIAKIRSAVEKVCSDARYRETLIEAGRRNIGRFSPQIIASQYADVYAEVSVSSKTCCKR